MSAYRPASASLFRSRKESQRWSPYYYQLRQSLLQAGFPLARHLGFSEVQPLELLKPGRKIRGQEPIPNPEEKAGFSPLTFIPLFSLLASTTPWKEFCCCPRGQETSQETGSFRVVFKNNPE